MRPIAEPLILSVSGPDRPGILAQMASALDAADIEIVDIEQATLQDFLALSFLLDLKEDPERSRNLLGDVLPKATELGLTVNVRRLDADQVRLLKESDHAVLTVVTDRPSARLIAEMGNVTARHRGNIVTIRRLTEEDLRAGEYVLDISQVPDLNALKADLLRAAESMGADAGLAREDIYRTSKRVVVFDMDNTLVVGEIIDELARRAGTVEEVSRITTEAMEGRMEFADALRRRVELLRGLPEETLEDVARNLTLTPGAEDAIRVLKRLGYKLGVLSGGFTFFAEALKERLGVDYAFANTLEIVDGKLTGRVVGPILDGQGKAERLLEIAKQEGVRRDQVVGVGDGANDVPMLQAAGLGIAFRAKETAKRNADASIQQNDFIGLLYLLGVSGRDLKRMHDDTASRR